MDLSSVFDKKVGDFNKKGISKPYKLRAGDSERLLFSKEEKQHGISAKRYFNWLAVWSSGGSCWCTDGTAEQTTENIGFAKMFLSSFAAYSLALTFGGEV